MNVDGATSSDRPVAPAAANNGDPAIPFTESSTQEEKLSSVDKDHSEIPSTPQTYASTSSFDHGSESEPAFDSDGEEIFYVERILKKKTSKEGQVLYFVKWKNYPDKMQKKPGRRRGRRKAVGMVRDPDPDYDETLPRHLRQSSQKPRPHLNRRTSTPLSLSEPAPSSSLPQNSAARDSAYANGNSVSSSKLAAAAHFSGKRSASKDLPNGIPVVKAEEPDSATDGTSEGRPEFVLSAEDMDLIERRKRSNVKTAKKAEKQKAGRKRNGMKPSNGISTPPEPSTSQITHPLHITSDSPSLSPRKVSKIELLLKQKRPVKLEDYGDISPNPSPEPEPPKHYSSNVAKIFPMKRTSPDQSHTSETGALVEEDSSDEESSASDTEDTGVEFTVISDGDVDIVFAESRTPYGFFENFPPRRSAK